MPAAVVTVCRENCSHVEGVVRRQRRVWTLGRPLASAPAAVAVLSGRFAGLRNDGAPSLYSHTLAPPASAPGRGLCEALGLQSVHAEELEPSQARQPDLPMGPW